MEKNKNDETFEFTINFEEESIKLKQNIACTLFYYDKRGFVEPNGESLVINSNERRSFDIKYRTLKNYSFNDWKARLILEHIKSWYLKNYGSEEIWNQSGRDMIEENKFNFSNQSIDNYFYFEEEIKDKSSRSSRSSSSSSSYSSSQSSSSYSSSFSSSSSQLFPMNCVNLDSSLDLDSSKNLYSLGDSTLAREKKSPDQMTTCCISNRQNLKLGHTYEEPSSRFLPDFDLSFTEKNVYSIWIKLEPSYHFTLEECLSDDRYKEIDFKRKINRTGFEGNIKSDNKTDIKLICSFNPDKEILTKYIYFLHDWQLTYFIDYEVEMKIDNKIKKEESENNDEETTASSSTPEDYLSWPHDKAINFLTMLMDKEMIRSDELHLHLYVKEEYREEQKFKTALTKIINDYLSL